MAVKILPLGENEVLEGYAEWMEENNLIDKWDWAILQEEYNNIKNNRNQKEVLYV